MNVQEGYMNVQEGYTNVQVGVPQYCSHFCFVHFSASKAPINSILDIIQQLFSCRFLNYPFCDDVAKS